MQREQNLLSGGDQVNIWTRAEDRSVLANLLRVRWEDQARASDLLAGIEPHDETICGRVEVLKVGKGQREPPGSVDKSAEVLKEVYHI